jgi:hypothetical protein
LKVEAVDLDHHHSNRLAGIQCGKIDKDMISKALRASNK